MKYENGWYIAFYFAFVLQLVTFWCYEKKSTDIFREWINKTM